MLTNHNDWPYIVALIAAVYAYARLQAWHIRRCDDEEHRRLRRERALAQARRREKATPFGNRFGIARNAVPVNASADRSEPVTMATTEDERCAAGSAASSPFWKEKRR